MYARRVVPQVIVVLTSAVWLVSGSDLNIKLSTSATQRLSAAESLRLYSSIQGAISRQRTRSSVNFATSLYRSFGGVASFSGLVKEQVAALSLEDALRVAHVPTSIAVMFRNTTGDNLHPFGGSHMQEVFDLAAARSSTQVRSDVPAERLTGVDNDPEKAVEDLNSLIVKAWERLDQKVLECADFDEKIQQSRREVADDLARLAQQAANSAQRITSTQSEINAISTTLQYTEEQLKREKATRAAVQMVDEQQLKSRISNLDVSEYLLDMSRCPAAELLQQHHHHQHHRRSLRSSGQDTLERVAMTGFEACLREEDVLNLTFEDPKLGTLVKNLDPKAQRLLAAYLIRAPLAEEEEEKLFANRPMVGGALGLLHHHQTPYGDTITSAKEEKESIRCVSGKPNCGVLHDMFASLWGEMKDLVEETRLKYYEDDLNFKKLIAGLMSQKENMVAQKAALRAVVEEATTNNQAVRVEQARKQVEKEQLQKLYDSTTGECKTTVQEILFNEMCGLVKVRNEVITKRLPNVNVLEIVDCEVGQWIPGQCSVPCDDALAGGTQTLVREVITMNTKRGAACPNLELVRTCNQVKCPVDCQLTAWTNFTACTAACGGGIRMRTREHLIKPKNGGSPCGVLMESEQCGAGACDVDCKLSDWTSFSSCSSVCGGGFLTRSRQVLTAPKGHGLCAPERDPKRMEEKECNQDSCVGDEVCLSYQDLVIAIDGSGSVTQEGFDVLKEFAARLVKRLEVEAYGREGMKVSVIQFGNGKLDKDRVVTDAKIILQPSDDMDKAAKQIRGMQWQKGFTNMAQAFLKAKHVFRTHSRKDAPKIVLLITDGRPSFKVQTSFAAQDLKAEGVRVVVVHVQANRKAEIVNLLGDYASTPLATNYIHIPGRLPLAGNYDLYMTKVLTRLCPESYSPSKAEAEEQANGFRKVREKALCVEEGMLATLVGQGVKTCYQFAQTNFGEGGWSQFASDAALGCIVYLKPCSEFTSNSTMTIYGAVNTSIMLGSAI